MNILMALNDMSLCSDAMCVIELSKELILRGSKVVIVSKPGELTKLLESLEITHYQVALDSKTPAGIMKANKILGKIVTEQNINIVHYHSPEVSYTISKFCKKHKLPLVATANSYKTCGLKKLSKRSDKLLVLTEEQKQYLVENCRVPKENVLVTVRGIDTERFCINKGESFVNDKFNIDSQDNLVVHISRLDKKHSLIAYRLIESVLKLDNIVENLKCIIVGDGDDFDNVKKAADSANEKMGREIIHLPGICQDTTKYIAVAKLFVGKSRFAMEAMASAKPVILAGYDGYLGLLSKSNIEECIKNHFCFLGGKEPDVNVLSQDIGAFFGLWDEEQEAIGALGRKTILDHFSLNAMTDDAENAYKAVLEE